MDLCHVEPGKEVVLKDILGGRGMRARLFSMGLLPGTKLMVLGHKRHGPIMLRVRDCNMVLGRGMAEKISVE